MVAVPNILPMLCLCAKKRGRYRGLTGTIQSGCMCGHDVMMVTATEFSLRLFNSFGQWHGLVGHLPADKGFVQLSRTSWHNSRAREMPSAVCSKIVFLAIESNWLAHATVRIDLCSHEHGAVEAT
jgi:hypothetical protein